MNKREKRGWGKDRKGEEARGRGGRGIPHRICHGGGEFSLLNIPSLADIKLASVQLTCNTERGCKACSVQFLVDKRSLFLSAEGAGGGGVIVIIINLQLIPRSLHR